VLDAVSSLVGSSQRHPFNKGARSLPHRQVLDLLSGPSALRVDSPGTAKVPDFRLGCRGAVPRRQRTFTGDRAAIIITRFNVAIRSAVGPNAVIAAAPQQAICPHSSLGLELRFRVPFFR
jgi:hypothetical protein